jgi:hypothetical protein
MKTEIGIKEITEALDLALQVVESAPKIYADEKISMSDWSEIWNIFQKAGPAAEGMKEIPSELKDLSAEEMAILIARVELGYSTGTEKSKKIVVKTLTALKELYEVHLLIKE